MLASALLAVLASGIEEARSQGTTVPGEGPGQHQPTPGDPKRTIPEEIEKTPRQSVPRAGGPSADETLSEQLDRNQGVIKPPQGVDPGIKVPAPVPNPNSTPVIPPPGSPGNPSPVQPK